MNKLYKISIILLIIITLFSVGYKVEASQESIWDKANRFLKIDEIGTFSELPEFLKIVGLGNVTKNGFELLIDTLWGFGLLVIFVSTVVLGMKYMLVLPNERSRIKQATTPYIIGVIIIFGALTIWKFIIVVLDGSL